MSKYIAYTDGGCNNKSIYGEGGSAYLILHKGEIVKIASKGFLNTTNNRMEMLAIVSAAYSVPDGSDLLVFSDSKYAINVFSGRWKPSKNLDLVQRYQAIAKNLNSVEFRWVKGHSGNRYNEAVDSLCSEAIERIANENSLLENRFTKKLIRQESE